MSTKFESVGTSLGSRLDHGLGYVHDEVKKLQPREEKYDKEPTPYPRSNQQPRKVIHVEEEREDRDMEERVVTSRINPHSILNSRRLQNHNLRRIPQRLESRIWDDEVEQQFVDDEGYEEDYGVGDMGYEWGARGYNPYLRGGRRGAMRGRGYGFMPRETREDDRMLRIDIPEFGGTMKAKAYLEWERSLDRYFEFKEMSDERRYKVAKLRLSKTAEMWLTGVQEQRARERKERINTWTKLKKYIKRKYVPSTYKQQQLVKWSSLTQGRRSVPEYQRECERLTVECEVPADDDLRKSKFVAVLNADIKEKVELQPYLGYDDMVQLAITTENQRKKKGGTYGSEVLHHDTVTATRGDASTSKPSVFDKGKALMVSSERRPEASKALKYITCFKCHGKGHYKQDCPNVRAFTTTEWVEIESTPSKRTMVVQDGGQEVLFRKTDDGKFVEYRADDSSDEHDVCRPEEKSDDDVRVMVNRRVLRAKPYSAENEQRENIFQTRCKIEGKLCDLIVDGGSETNLVAKELVSELGLPTVVHSKPYRLGWLNNKEGTYLRKQCMVSFKVGSYFDKLLLDVVPMDACDVLLGRPWQSDRNSKHDGYRNTYTIWVRGQKRVLELLPPSMCVPRRLKRSNDNSEVKSGYR